MGGGGSETNLPYIPVGSDRFKCLPFCHLLHEDHLVRSVKNRGKNIHSVSVLYKMILQIDLFSKSSILNQFSLHSYKYFEHYHSVVTILVL